jgi:hypothetical protein
MLERQIMERIVLSLTHHFANGESSTTTNDTGSLDATTAAVFEIYWSRKIAEAMLRMGSVQAKRRDPEFQARMAEVVGILEGKDAG